jgi:precorrin-8X/cobalt-precorrin-8 methylmutase
VIKQLIPYERDPKLIYAASFATVKKEANLERFSPEMQSVVIRLIHACGMIEVADTTIMIILILNILKQNIH